MTNRTVLVSGAGIAGVTLAHWLRRHGFSPTVVERAPGPRQGGYKIDIRGAALRVVERMGLLDDIRARATGVRAGSVVDARGRRVASMDGDTFGGRAHDDAEILRGDLQRLIVDATQDVEYLWGDAIADLAQTGDAVTITFASGATRTFDLVVGADGLHSVTRGLVFGDGLDREELTYVSPGRTVLVYSTAQDTAAKAMFLFADDTPVPEDGRAYLAGKYRDEGWAVPTLLDGMDAAPDFYLDSLGQVHLDRWSDGRVALVGAYVLAGELAGANGHHVAGFANYEAALRDFVAVNQKLGPANVKRMVLSSRAGVWFSMTFLALLSKLPGKDRLIAKAIEPINKAANAITLREYVRTPS